MVWPATVLLSTTSVSTLTALLKVVPWLWVKVSVLKAWTLPTCPVTSTWPWVPAFKVTACALSAKPFKVLPNVMLAPAANAPLLVVSNVVLTVTTASSAMTIEFGLLVRTEPPLNVLVPAASVSK